MGCKMGVSLERFWEMSLTVIKKHHMKFSKKFKIIDIVLISWKCSLIKLSSKRTEEDFPAFVN